MANDYFFSVRGRSGDGYSNKLGTARYLSVPPGTNELKRHLEIPVGRWVDEVQEASGAVAAGTNGNPDPVHGHVLVFVHGFNTDQWDMLERHRRIRDGLARQGFPGVVISFDWPSDGVVLGYSADRRDARLSADLLFTKGITRLSKMQEPDCIVNVHVLAHSMGTFLVREAFDFADDDHETALRNWTMSQVAFVAGDIAQKSFDAGSPKVSSLLRHCTRLTNYWSPFDEVLSISEVKRVGVSRRLGRVGLPAGHNQKAVNLYCGKHFDDNRPSYPTDKAGSHRWYFESDTFYEDLHHTLMGQLDRSVIPTRLPASDGGLALKS